MPFNSEIFFQIYNLSGHNFVFDQLMIFSADYLIWLIFVLVIFLAIFGNIKERKALVLSIIGLIITNFVIINFIHLFFQEPRPFLIYNISPLIPPPNSFGFPSGHTAMMATITFTYIFVKSKFVPLFLLLLFLIGLARIYVGVHYPFDILGGILVGFLSVWFSNWLLKLIFKSASQDQV